MQLCARSHPLIDKVGSMETEPAARACWPCVDGLDLRKVHMCTYDELSKSGSRARFERHAHMFK